jgi:hypothetical protein
MPSGFTNDLYDGKDVSFQGFTMKCARAFGALIMMRDERLDAEIVPEKVSTFHTDALARAKAELAEAQAMTMTKAKALAQEAYNDSLKRHQEEALRTDALVSRYQKMLDEVKAWEPPTESHVGLKTFMIEQLTTGLQHDCYQMELPTLEDPGEYMKSALGCAQNSVEYHTTGLAAETARVKERNQWVADLRNSLGSR